MPAHGVDRTGAAGGSGANDNPIAVTIVTAKGDLIAGTASGTVDNLAVGANETRVVADSNELTGLKYVPDTTNYAVGAKGDLLAGTAADTLAALAVGTDGYTLTPLTGAATGLAYIAPSQGFSLVNGYLDWTVSGNVLTVAVKGFDGNDPSATNPVYILFRDATASNGGLTLRKLTAATTIAANDTATYGTASSVAFRLWCVAFDDAGTIRLALINCVTSTAGAGAGRDVSDIYRLAGWGIASATLEDNSSDSAQVFYSSGAAVTDKAYATLGFATWESGLGTAGTWSAGPTRKQLFGQGVPLPGQAINSTRHATGAVATGTTTMPVDDTIPQNTEGTQFLTKAITRSSAANVLRIWAQAQVSHNAAASVSMGIALFQDATANALAAFYLQTPAQNQGVMLPLDVQILCSASGSTTFNVRIGTSSAGTATLNGSDTARLWGGVANSFLHIEEVMG
jgi:hypothetical protein